MKKTFMILFCVVLCMFAFTAGVSATSAMDELTAVDWFGATMDRSISGVTPFADGDGSSDENAKKGSYQISVTTDGNGKYLGSEFIEKRDSDGLEMYWVYVLPNDGYELYTTAKDSGTATKLTLTADNFATWTDGVTEEPNAMRFKVGLAADASYAVTFQQIYRFLITSNVEWAASSEDTEKPYLELSKINPNYKVS